MLSRPMGRSVTRAVCWALCLVMLFESSPLAAGPAALAPRPGRPAVPLTPPEAGSALPGGPSPLAPSGDPLRGLLPDPTGASSVPPAARGLPVPSVPVPGLPALRGLPSSSPIGGLNGWLGPGARAAPPAGGLDWRPVRGLGGPNPFGLSPYLLGVDLQTTRALARAFAPLGAGPQVLCVQAGSPATGAPCTNATAFNAIQDAANAANPGDEIRVANGTYQVASGTAVVSLPTSVALRGGYGGGTSGWTTQGPATNTVIDGQGARFGISVGSGVTATIQNLAVNNGGIQNAGTVTVDTGMLILQNGGTTSGAFSLASGSTLTLAGGGQTFANGTALSGAGLLWIDGGTLTVGSVSSDQVAGQNVQLDNFATMNGSGTLTVNGGFVWTNGATIGGGTGTLTIGTGATLTVSGSNRLDLDGWTVNNQGTATWTITQPGVVFDNNPTFNNRGSLTVQNDGGVFCCGGAFNNLGTLIEAAGTRSTGFGGFGTTFNNSGTVSLQSGGLNLNGGGTSTGPFTGAGGTTLGFGGGTNNLNAGATVNTQGTVDFFGGTTNLADAFTASGTIVDGAPGVFATANFNSPSQTSTGSLLINAGQANFNGPTTAATVTLGGCGCAGLGGTGAVTIMNSLTWTGGGIGGSGTLTIPPAASLAINGGTSLSGRTIANQGSATWSGTSSMTWTFGAQFVNSGTFTVQNDESIFFFGGGSGPVFTNNGTFTKVAGTGTTAFDNVPFNNTGTVNAQSGRIALAGGGTNTGTFTIASGATIDVSTTTYTLGTGAAVTGPGFLRVTVDPFQGAAAGNLAVGTNLSVPSLELDAGSISGAGPLTVTGAMSWNGGEMGPGGGTTTIATGATLTLNGGFLRNWTLTNQGTTSWTATGDLFLESGSVINNAGTFVAQNNQAFQGGTDGTFNNSGTFTKSGGTGTSSMNVPFNNTGAVSVQTGTLNVNGQGLTGTPGGGTSTGPFTGAAGTTLGFGGHTLNPGATVNTAGTLNFFTGTTTLNDAVTANTITVTGGTALINVPTTIPNVALSSGTLAGSGPMTVTNLFTWTGSTIGGSGTTTIASGATLAISGTNAGILPILDTRTLTNQGTINWTGTTQLRMGNGAVLNNAGTFNVLNNQYLLNNGGANTAINNTGLLVKSTSGLTSFGGDAFVSSTVFPNVPISNSGTIDLEGGVTEFVSLTNTGTLKVNAATVTVMNDSAQSVNPFSNAGTLALGPGAALNFDGTLVQTGGSTIVTNANLLGPAINVEGGTLGGVGVIAANVTNAGTVAPGPNGTLIIFGTYTQTSSGNLNIAMAGPTPGTQFGQLNPTLGATLAGTLILQLSNGFAPLSGQTFQVLYGIPTGTFSTINGTDAGNGRTFGIGYNAHDVTLAVTGPGPTAPPPPPPPSIQALSVSVASADSLTTNVNMPDPWQGSPNVVFLGKGEILGPEIGFGTGLAPPFDSGAIRLDNPTSQQVEVQSAQGIVHAGTSSPLPFNLWGQFVIPPGSSVILAANGADGAVNSVAFDPDDFPLISTCGPPAAPTFGPNLLTITLADGSNQTYTDSGHILDNGGMDVGRVCSTPESLQWRPIGTTDTTSKSSTLTLAPASSTVGLGSPAPVQATLLDAANSPLPDVVVNFQVTAGPNAGQIGQGTTDFQGHASFGYTSSQLGTDTVQASVTNTSGGSFSSNSVTVTWIVAPPATATPTASATPTVTSTATPTNTPVPNAWSSVANLPTARYFLGATAGPDGRIYALGGFNAALGGDLNTAEVYDAALSRWSPVAPLPTARFGLAATLGQDGRLYAIGGARGASLDYLNTVEAYDPATNQWTTRASLPTARAFLAAATGADGRIYALGGIASTGVLATVEVYDPASNTWSAAASLPTPRFGLGAALGADGRLYAAGGTGSGGSPTSDVAAYTPGTNTWATVASLPTARVGLALGLTIDGRLFAAGGDDGAGHYLGTVEALGASGPAWTTVDSLPTAREGLAVARGADGRLYAIAGVNGSGVLGVVEAFGPAFPTPTPSTTTTATITPTLTPTATATPTFTATATPTATRTVTPTATASVTPTPTATASATTTSSPTATASATPTPVPLPDLIISNMSAAVQESPNQNPQIQLTIDVKNQGTAGTGTGFEVGVFVDPPAPPQPGQTPFLAIQSGPLAAGATNPLVANFSLTGGTHAIWALADDQNAIIESNKTNNLLGPLTLNLTGPTSTPTVSGTPATSTPTPTSTPSPTLSSTPTRAATATATASPVPLPDLTVSGLSAFVVESPDTNPQVQLTIDVLNQGTAGTGAGFEVGVFVDPPAPPQPGQAPFLAIPSGPLAAGQTEEFVANLTLTGGTHTISVLADDTNAIVESNKANNLASLTLNLIGPTATPTVSGTPPTQTPTSTAPPTGTVTPTATASASATATGTATGTPTVTQTPTVTPTRSGPPPSVTFTGLTEGQTITAPTALTGSVTSPTLASWVLSYRYQGQNAATQFASSTTAVVNGTLGTFDPSLLLDGIYEIDLTATDVSGQSSTAAVNVVVTGNLKVGNFRLAYTDLDVPVDGIPIQVLRSYDSTDKTQGDFGIGWQLGLRGIKLQENGPPGVGWQGTSDDNPIQPTFCLQPAKPHVITISFPDGTVDQFQASTNPSCQLLQPIDNATLTFTPLPGTVDTLVPLNGADVFIIGSLLGPVDLLDLSTSSPADPTRYQLTLADGRVLVFDRINGLQSISDPRGNTLTFTPNGISHSSGKSIAFQRDGQGRITQITDPLGNHLSYSYDAQGNLVSVTDQLGGVNRFTYDANHDLLTVTDPFGRQDVRTDYDAQGRMISVTDANGQTTTFTHDLNARREVVTDRLGHPTTYAYDVQGNVVAQTDPLGNTSTFTYDASGNRLSQTDPLGQTTTFTYDASNRLLNLVAPDGTSIRTTRNALGEPLSQTDPLGNTYTFTYDAKGDPLTQTDPLGNTTTMTFDPAGNVLTSQDPLGNVTRSTYDASGNRLSQTDPLGTVTASTYDANGDVLTRTTTGLLNGTTQSLTWSYVYDARGDVLQKTDPAGNVTRYTYDVEGERLSLTDPLGNVTTYGYDTHGKLINTTYPDGTSESTVYNAENYPISSTDRAGRITTYTYDVANRPIQTTHPDGTGQSYAYDAAGRLISQTDEDGATTTFAYDALGRRTSLTDPLGNITRFGYDAAGNQISQTDANGHVTTTTHDADRRPVKVTFADGTTSQTVYDALGRKVAETDPAGNATSYRYDALGRLAGVTDALGDQTQFAYDAFNDQTSQTDALGNVTRFAYDTLGRTIGKTLPLGQTATFGYDADGRLTSLKDYNGATTTSQYDSVGRLVQRALPDGTTESFGYSPTGQVVTATDASKTMTYTYDLRDRPTQVQEPDGTVLQYTYDGVGRRTSLATPDGATRYGYDAAGRLTSVVDPAGGQTSYTYDAAGNRTGLNLPNGDMVRYTYDARNRLTFQTEANGPIALRTYAYTLAPDGNRTGATESTGRTVSYTYDALLRLTNEAINDPTSGASSTSYTYDAAGDRLTKTDSTGTTNYTYDANSRMLTAGSVSFGYDGNGNTVSKTDASGTVSYQYDGLNRLVGATEPSSLNLSFVYDAMNNRVQTVLPGVTTNEIVDPFGMTGLAQVVRETDGTGAKLAGYVYGLDLLSMARPTGTSYFLYDGQMSTRLLTDGTGAITDSYDYDAFGVLLKQTGTTSNEFLYNGQQLDPNLGFYYLRARYYAPAFGRFLTRDPFGGTLYDPVSLHPYLYAHDDPIDRSDPSGRFDFVDLLCVAVIVGILATSATYSVHHDVGEALWAGFVSFGLVVTAGAELLPILGYFGSVTGGGALAGGAAGGGLLAGGTGAAYTNTLLKFNQVVDASGQAGAIDVEAVNVLNRLGGEIAPNEGGPEVIQRELELYQTSDQAFQTILDRDDTRLVNVNGVLKAQDVIPSKDLPMYALQGVVFRAQSLLINYESASQLERIGQLKFWIQVACIGSALLRDPPTRLRVATGATTYEFVQC